MHNATQLKKNPPKNEHHRVHTKCWGSYMYVKVFLRLLRPIKKCLISGHRLASKSVRWLTLLFFWPTFCWSPAVYTGTEFHIYKVWWLREASQIGQTFIPLCKKRRLKHSTAQFQIDPAILAAIGHRFIAKKKENLKCRCAETRNRRLITTVITTWSFSTSRLVWTELNKNDYFAVKIISGFWYLRALPQTHSSELLVFSLFAIKRCPIAAKIAGSIGILPCFVLNNFFFDMGGLYVCPICAASLRHWFQ